MVPKPPLLFTDHLVHANPSTVLSTRGLLSQSLLRSALNTGGAHPEPRTRPGKPVSEEALCESLQSGRPASGLLFTFSTAEVQSRLELTTPWEQPQPWLSNWQCESPAHCLGSMLRGAHHFKVVPGSGRNCPCSGVSPSYQASLAPLPFQLGVGP